MIATGWLTVSDDCSFRRCTARPTSTPRCPGVRPCTIVVLVTSSPRLTAVSSGSTCMVTGTWVLESDAFPRRAFVDALTRWGT